MLSWNRPLNQQEFEPSQIGQFLTNRLELTIKETSTNNGFLLLCSRCQTNQLFYNFSGKIFVFLNYKGCGWKRWSLLQLRISYQRAKKQTR